MSGKRYPEEFKLEAVKQICGCLSDSASRPTVELPLLNT